MVEVSEKIHPPFRARGCPRIKGKSKGFFTVEEHDGIWWFISPDGEGFFAIGTDHANYNGHPCEKLGYAPYRRNCEEIHGGIEAWTDSTVSRLRSWGFNTLGWGHSHSLRYRELAHTEFMEFGTVFTKSENISPPITWTGFPDVFSPNFRDHCDEVAKRCCSPNRDDPWLIGYFIDNEQEWFGRSGHEEGLFEETLKKNGDHPAKKRLMQLLQSKYSNVKALNSAWGVNLRSFNEVLSLNQAPPLNNAIEQDARLFLKLVAEEYFSITTSAVRRYDPNHLILGCRFGSNAPAAAWEAAGRYCDVVSVNCYRTIDFKKGILSDGFEEDLRKWYRLAEKPLMLTEWSFPAMDAGLPCKHGAGQRVPTQKDRARAFTIFQRLLFSTSFIVGSYYFMWVDEPALGISSAFPEDSNYGLVNEQDEPYVEITQAASKLNPQACEIHSDAGKI